MTRPNISKRVVEMQFDNSSRRVKWGELCFAYLGARNVEDIRRVDRELTLQRRSSFIALDGTVVALKPIDWWVSPTMEAGGHHVDKTSL